MEDLCLKMFLSIDLDSIDNNIYEEDQLSLQNEAFTPDKKEAFTPDKKESFTIGIKSFKKPKKLKKLKK